MGDGCPPSHSGVGGQWVTGAPPQWVGELLQAQGQALVGTAGGELQAVLSAVLTRIQRL